MNALGDRGKVQIRKDASKHAIRERHYLPVSGCAFADTRVSQGTRRRMRPGNCLSEEKKKKLFLVRSALR
jgi:hypothetical protein